MSNRYRKERSFYAHQSANNVKISQPTQDAELNTLAHVPTTAYVHAYANTYADTPGIC